MKLGRQYTYFKSKKSLQYRIKFISVKKEGRKKRKRMYPIKDITPSVNTLWIFH